MTTDTMIPRSCHRGRLSRPCVSLAVLTSVALGASQGHASDVYPSEINDCTFLTDPAKLQQCIIQRQGGSRIRGRLSSEKRVPDPILPNSETPASNATEFKGPP